MGLLERIKEPIVLPGLMVKLLQRQPGIDYGAGLSFVHRTGGSLKERRGSSKTLYTTVVRQLPG